MHVVKLHDNIRFVVEQRNGVSERCSAVVTWCWSTVYRACSEHATFNVKMQVSLTYFIFV